MHKIRLSEHGYHLALAGAGAVLMPLLGLRLWYELQGPLTADSPIYLAVGRGIMNGLVPYQDLFETKPPGIFLVSALSLWLTGGTALLSVLQVIAIVAVPVTMLLAVHEQRHDNHTRRFAFASATLLGAMLALYGAERSGEFQVESFGAAFAGLCIWGAQRMKRHGGHSGIFLMILGTFGAVGMKEPFALSVLAATLLLSKNMKTGVHTLSVTYVITALLGITLLGVLGYLGPYVSLYLKEMFGNHIVAGEPMGLRALHVERLVRDLWAFSAPFTVTLLAMWTVLIVTTFRRAHAWAIRGDLLLRHTVAILALSMAVGMGGAYYNHHFIFALPCFAAVCVAFLENIEHVQKDTLRMLGHGTLALLCLAGSAGVVHGPYEMWADIQRSEQVSAIQMAATIDDILDSCGEERYLFIGANGIQPYGFTKHSPLGPVFFQYDYFLNGQRPSFSDAFDESIAHANIIVMQVSPAVAISEHARAALEAGFIERAPCALGKTLPSNYRLLYRAEVLR